MVKLCLPRKKRFKNGKMFIHACLSHFSKILPGLFRFASKNSILILEKDTLIIKKAQRPQEKIHDLSGQIYNPIKG